MSSSTKTGRKRVLTDEERIENKKRKDARIVKFSAPDGFKEILQQFVDSKGAKDIGAILVPLIKKDDEFKRFRISQIKQA